MQRSYMLCRATESFWISVGVCRARGSESLTAPKASRVASLICMGENSEKHVRCYNTGSSMQGSWMQGVSVCVRESEMGV